MLPAPLPGNESDRLTALHGYDILDTQSEQAFEDIAKLAAALCGAPMSVVSLIDGNRQWIKARVGIDSTETPHESSFCAHVILQSDVLIVPDTLDDVRLASNPLFTVCPDIRFYAGAPIITPSGHAVGAVCVLDRVPRELSMEQRDALEILARQAIFQLELRRMAGEQERALALQARREARLMEAQRVAHFGSWEFDLASRELTWSQEMFRLLDFAPSKGAPTYTKLLERYHPDDISMHSRIVRQCEEDANPYAYDIRAIMNDGSVRWFHTRGNAERDAQNQPVRLFGIMRDVTEEKAYQQRIEEQMLTIQESTVELEWQKGELEAANIKLEMLATTDGLTGLKNQRAVQERLREEFQRALRHNNSLSLVMVDVDKFKSYNDAFGHPAGDQVLQHVATVLLRTARTTDIVGRYGGEEFVVLLPETNADSAMQAAERFRAAIECAEWPQARITISLGVATLNRLTPDGSTLVSEADKALYKSKQSGRNCVSRALVW